MAVNTRRYNNKIIANLRKTIQNNRKAATRSGAPYYQATTTAALLKTSNDGRRLLRTERTVETVPSTQPESAAAAGDDDVPMRDTSPGPSNSQDAGDDDGVPIPKKRYLNSDYPLSTWVNEYRDIYLTEFARHDGRGESRRTTRCPDCRKDPALYPSSAPSVRCVDCFGGDLVCRECAARRHRRTPTHALEEWNGSYFDRISLKNLNQVVQLGHLPGVACPAPDDPIDFVLLDVNGVHHISLQYCGCCSVDRYKQLLRARWWPATPLRPASGATFRLLNLFNRLNVQGRTTAHNFWLVLEQLTDGSTLSKVPSRVEALRLMAREFSHVQLGKRLGRAHHSDGLERVANGELAMRCPACPRPGINMPPEDTIPESLRFLYRLIVAIDANFRLKNRIRPNSARDVSLTGSGAYFVDQEAYAKHVLTAATQDEISTCTGFAALAKANNKGRKGLRVTGVGACSCVHEFWQPNGVGDLQLGERYCNMDFIFVSVYSHAQNRWVIASYDVACQWCQNFWKRMEELPEDLQIVKGKTSVDFAIPKFHYDAHGTGGKDGDMRHIPFSLNFKPGVGRNECEGPERLWSGSNGASSSTKEMGPGARADALTSHFDHWNWQKTTSIGATLLKRLSTALQQAARHAKLFEDFNEVLDRERPGVRQQWEEMLVKWNADHTQPCPYVVPPVKISTAAVRLELAKKAAAAKDVDNPDAPNSKGVAPSELFVSAMDLEEAQRAFVAFAKELAPVDGGSGHGGKSKGKATDTQAAKINERRNALRRKLKAFLRQEAKTFPSRPRLAPNPFTDEDVADAPHTVSLPLPSTFAPNVSRAVYSEEDIDAERDLRRAESHEALGKVQYHLRVRTFFNRFKIKNITGQKPNTRARTLQAQVDSKIQSHVLRYRHGRERYLRLCGPTLPDAALRELKDEDVRGLSDRLLRRDELSQANLSVELRVRGGLGLAEGGADKEQGEGGRTLSWLWYSAGSDEHGINEAVRTEWAKSHARAARWHEDALIAREEMNRVGLSFDAHAKAWLSLAVEDVDDILQTDLREDKRRTRDVTPELRDGLNAYARKQAAMFTKLKCKFQKSWAPVLERANQVLKAMEVSGGLEATGVDDLDTIPVPATREFDDEYLAGPDDVEDDDDDDDDDDDAL